MCGVFITVLFPRVLSCQEVISRLTVFQGLADKTSDLLACLAIPDDQASGAVRGLLSLRRAISYTVSLQTSRRASGLFSPTLLAPHAGQYGEDNDPYEPSAEAASSSSTSSSSAMTTSVALTVRAIGVLSIAVCVSGLVAARPSSG